MSAKSSKIVAGGPTKQQDPETLADAVRRISKSVDALRRSGLNQRAIVALVHDDTKIYKSTIVQVLDSLAALEKKYCR